MSATITWARWIFRCDCTAFVVMANAEVINMRIATYFFINSPTPFGSIDGREQCGKGLQRLRGAACIIIVEHVSSYPNSYCNR